MLGVSVDWEDWSWKRRADRKRVRNARAKRKTRVRVYVTVDVVVQASKKRVIFVDEVKMADMFIMVGVV